jgi:predicted transglutaminase-like cysteine proteinase
MHVTTQKNGRGRWGFSQASGFGRIASALLCLALACAAPQAYGGSRDALPSAPRMPLGGEDDRPTTAWKAFCARLPAECAVDTTEPAFVTLTPEIWSLLQRTNLHVNQTITPITDQAHWGVNDRWDYPRTARAIARTSSSSSGSS